MRLGRCAKLTLVEQRLGRGVGVRGARVKRKQEERVSVQFRSAHFSKRKMSEDASMPTQGPALQQFYGDKTSTSYDESMDAEMVKVAHLLDLVEKTAPEGGVLDTCCGSGHMLAWFAAKNSSRELQGIDLSQDMVKIAALRCPQASIVQGNMLEITLSDAAFAIVMNTFALHHVTGEQARDAISNWASLLRPGGVIFLGIWEGEGNIDYGQTDFKALLHSKATVQSWLAAAGMAVAHSETQFEEELGMNALYMICVKNFA